MAEPRVTEHVAPAPSSSCEAPAPADTRATTATVTEYVTPAPVIELKCVQQFPHIMTGVTADVGRGLPQLIEDQIVNIPASPVAMIELVAPTPVIEYIAPAPPVTDSSPSQQLPRAYNEAAVATKCQP